MDNQPTVTGRSPGPANGLDVASALYLGGHGSFNHSRLPSDLALHAGFRGCVYDVVFRSRDVDFSSHWIPSVRAGRDVGQCRLPSACPPSAAAATHHPGQQGQQGQHGQC